LGGMYDYFSGDKIIVQLTKKAKKSSLLDGRYSFNLFRYAEEEADKIGNGIINISNGQITIDKKYRNLKTGEIDLYDTLNGQVVGAPSKDQITFALKQVKQQLMS
jgi:hypothetical protein